MNSFLICCKDIHLINTFYCIDDNSSEDDRKKMKENYPFFHYIFKNEEEKGHLKSMNIIWDQLNQLKPNYWIHLEDDWLFIKPCQYITKSIEFLERHKSEKIHQILFNKNYGEILNHYYLVGGKRIDDSFLLHIKDEPDLKGANCSYWPHYSFRPSMILTETILKLGNYDTNVTFFEREYANKYDKEGYSSAFYNEICTIHIGKLTNEKKNSKSAYYLNNIEQFNTNHQIDDNIIKDDINNTNITIDDTYVYIHNMDHFGDDISLQPNKSIEKLKNELEIYQECIGFNTLGYLKNTIDLDHLIKLEYDNKKHGLYIHIERYNNKYNVNIVEIIKKNIN